jgi:K+-sensing histidine kinase KdpD
MIDRYNSTIRKSKFAPAERLDKPGIHHQKNLIGKSDFLRTVLANIPLNFIIVNDQRQIVYSNNLLYQQMGYQNMDEILGLRPGEMFNCIHSGKEDAGCGTSDNCRYCGAVGAMLESQKKKITITKESRLTLSTKAGSSSQDFEVVSSPFQQEGENFYIVTFRDISDTKRREQLERVFFHDLINKVGSLSGLLDLLSGKRENLESGKILEVVNRGIKELMRDISFQRKIRQAENGELQLNLAELKAMDLLTNIREDFQNILQREDKEIEIVNNATQNFIVTDEVLLIRILTNLVKNALEASEKGDTVRLEIRNDPDSFLFLVSNPQVMPDHVHKQIFQRSFSTKGIGRGLGTYSIKLFTEKYLKGGISFTSREKTGTTFILKLPQNAKEDRFEQSKN